MITDNKPYKYDDRPIFCLSTDEKPYLGIANGCKLIEMDTSSVYFFDAEHTEWLLWNGGGQESGDDGGTVPAR